MLEQQLKEVVRKNRGGNPLVLRTKLKEALQDHILKFIYNSKSYGNFFFTGGTCLHRLYGLPRLSEDLDFDYDGQPLDLHAFTEDVTAYVENTLQYKAMRIRTTANGSVVLTFPILRPIGLAHRSSDSQTLLLRCDISRDLVGFCGEQRAPVSAGNAMFFVRAYDLPTLFANKLAAFINREYKKGVQQEIPFKGRDVFDLVWFLQRSQQNNWALVPNWQRLAALLQEEDKAHLLETAMKKAQRLDPRAVAEDLLPFMEDQTTLNTLVYLPETLSQQLEAFLRAVTAHGQTRSGSSDQHGQHKQDRPRLKN